MGYLYSAAGVGTGDLSKLALGYTTYGVGDHMSHYNVTPGCRRP
jgi:NAD+ synthase (glutamine-hydrolysing)